MLYKLTENQYLFKGPPPTLTLPERYSKVILLFKPNAAIICSARRPVGAPWDSKVEPKSNNIINIIRYGNPYIDKIMDSRKRNYNA